MAFYNDISKYYDSIFKVSNHTLDFLESSIGEAPKNILDVACGTGEYAINISKCGYNVTAVDLDQKMIQIANSKIKDSRSNVEFLKADMLSLSQKFRKNSFDGVYCIGNSLVHLNDVDQIKDFFKVASSLLKENGVFIFGIINYDRIISKDIRFLPTILNHSVPLKFERFYKIKETSGKIEFKTKLYVGDKVIENKIDLIPIMHDKVVSLLKDTGFNNVRLYGDFKKSIFNKDESYSLIVLAKK